MLKLVRNLALCAALVTVAVAVWRDYGAMVTLKRAALAYLFTFLVSGSLGLVAFMGWQVNRPAPPVEPDKKRSGRKKRSSRRGRPVDSPDGAEETAPAVAEPTAETPEPEPAGV